MYHVKIRVVGSRLSYNEIFQKYELNEVVSFHRIGRTDEGENNLTRRYTNPHSTHQYSGTKLQYQKYLVKSLREYHHIIDYLTNVYGSVEYIGSLPNEDDLVEFHDSVIKNPKNNNEFEFIFMIVGGPDTGLNYLIINDCPVWITNNEGKIIESLYCYSVNNVPLDITDQTEVSF